MVTIKKSSLSKFVGICKNCFFNKKHFFVFSTFYFTLNKENKHVFPGEKHEVEPLVANALFPPRNIFKL